MKTVSLGKKEYVIIERTELAKTLNEIDNHLCTCETYAHHHKEMPNPDIWRDFDMDQIMTSARNGREKLRKLIQKGV